ncbi:MAG: hypothetical protein H6834_09160 [Planctomycetes bacterium]|nr:hypothetical protein [Planctomycetota bacterium]
MKSWTLQIEGPHGVHGHALGDRMHLVGSGPTCDVRIEGLEPEHLQLWRTDDGYRVVQMVGERVLVDGRAVDEIELRGGEVLVYREVRFSFLSADDARPAAAPRAADPEPPRQAPTPSAVPVRNPVAPADAFARLLAGAWLASASKVRPALRGRWEKILKASESWEPQTCANELVDDVREDVGVQKAAVNALRDGMAERLIRKARKKTARKRLLAKLFVQLLVFSIAMVVVLAVQTAMRQSDVDWNAFFDGILERLAGFTKAS